MLFWITNLVLDQMLQVLMLRARLCLTLNSTVSSSMYRNQLMKTVALYLKYL